MKILLAAVNSRFTHSNFALRYLRSSIKESGFDSTLVEFTVNQQLRDVVNEIYEHAPDVLVLSLYIWNGEFVCKLAGELKTIMPQLIIVGGGPELEAVSNGILADTSPFDYRIVGAGESSIRYLADNNFACKEKILSRPASPLDEQPFPYTEDDMVSLKNRFVYYESSRYCPYRCSYCLSSESPAKVEYRSLEKVFSELAFFASHDAGTVKFVDRTFNANRKRARQIWQYLLETPGNTVWHFEIHPELIEQDDIALLTKFPAGKIRLEIGVQTLNEKSLEAVHRNMDCARSLENIRKLREIKTINLHLDLIAGLPLDDMLSFKISFNAIYGLQPDELQLGFLKVLPGTQIHRDAGKYGIMFMQSPPYTVYSTNGFTFTEIATLEKIDALVDAVKNRHMFDTTLEFLESSFSSPYDMYDSLAAFYKSMKIKTDIADWKKIAAMIIGMAENRGMNPDAAVDALRWDWILCGSGGYPDLLCGDNMERLRKDALEHIRKEFDAGAALPFERRHAGKLIFFRSFGGLLQNERCPAGKTLAVLKNGKQSVDYLF